MPNVRAKDYAINSPSWRWIQAAPEQAADVEDALRSLLLRQAGRE